MNRPVIAFCACLIALAATSGCGLVEIERTLFPNQATDINGDLLFVEDLTDIIEDPALLPTTMEFDLERTIGITNGDLVDALVADGLTVDGTIFQNPNDDTGSGDGTDGGDDGG